MTDKNEFMMPKFTGDEDEWPVYKLRVKATAKEKGWHKALLEDRDIPTEEHIESGEATEEEKLVYQENMKATELAFQQLDLAEENARIAWTTFTDKYDSSSESDLIKMTEKLGTCHLADHTSPDEWIMKLETLNLLVAKIDSGAKLSEKRMIATILTCLPKE